ncbi:double-stranded RNA-binding protein 2-like isoform X1 [Tripterygium wilfordii]|uniref:Double-stranded RNA-binding protein 2-like isoform X1 n=1 Tax=Tripterygium wilfordii TaxID=458696 RepID=A0A7J7DS94_TRIWF|nr:double-stranded RNA-binding protein 1-like isoform X2 [Tripterygium wilfordii]KAF5749159.1 double-stranded RNA-binding protein 2-like isoform X1 [Tripterygium wilfordii]
MYKTRLQEICQRKRWSLPKYSVEKTGLDHIPHFQATVTVNGLTFTSDDKCNSSKDAQNEAAMRAFNHLSVPEFNPSKAPIPFEPSSLPGTSSITNDLNKEFPTRGASQQKSQEMNQIPRGIATARLVIDNDRCKDTDREAEANIYKSKLNEFCQRNRWRPPDYMVKKKGPDHFPQFQATVTVNGVSFTTHDQCKSSKDAQNNAARIAFDHFCTPNIPSSLSPIPSNSSLRGNDFTNTAKMKITEASLSAIADLKDMPLTETSQLKPQKTNQVPQLNGNAIHVKHNDRFIDMQHSYKNQLQNYTQKSNVNLPAYYHEGPPHTSHFKGVVGFGEKTYESHELFPTMKEAEHVAAKVALMPLSKNEVQEASIPVTPTYYCDQEGPPHTSHFKGVVGVGEKTYESNELFPTMKEAEHVTAKVALMPLSKNEIQEDESRYKNLLQELAQKECYGLPSYNTLKSGEPHVPIFVSTVEVEGELFTGREAKTKKQAEMSAARIAYKAIKDRMASQSPNAHQGKGNPEFLSSGSHYEKTTDRQQNFEAELPPIPQEEHEEEIELFIGVDPSSIQSPVSGGNSAVNDELSSTSSCFYDSDADSEPRAGSTISSYTDTSSRPDTEPPAGSTFSSYTDTSSSPRVIVFPRSHPRSVPPGGAMKILNDEFVSYKYKSEPYMSSSPRRSGNIAHLHEY